MPLFRWAISGGWLGRLSTFEHLAILFPITDSFLPRSAKPDTLRCFVSFTGRLISDSRYCMLCTILYYFSSVNCIISKVKKIGRQCFAIDTESIKSCWLRPIFLYGLMILCCMLVSDTFRFNLNLLLVVITYFRSAYNFNFGGTSWNRTKFLCTSHSHIAFMLKFQYGGLWWYRTIVVILQTSALQADPYP